MDWVSVAPLLLELASMPVLVVDPTGRVQLVNEALERLVGWTREEIVGHRAIHAWVPERAVKAVDGALRRARAGTRRRLDCPLRTRGGAWIQVSLDFAAVGSGTERAMVVSVSGGEVLPSEAAIGGRAKLSVTGTSTQAPVGPPSCAIDDLEYEISTRDFGVILWVSPSRSRTLPLGARCYEARFAVAVPCTNCPAAKLRRSGEQAHGVVGGSAGRLSVEFVTARQCEPNRARIRVLPLDDDSLRAAARARVERLAETSKLSARERTVLHMLIQGQSPEQIAKELGIVQRTVKFHQTNLLSKLGAESRIDLLRVLI